MEVKQMEVKGEQGKKLSGLKGEEYPSGGPIVEWSWGKKRKKSRLGVREEVWAPKRAVS
jgi:hypothetical protein